MPRTSRSGDPFRTALWTVATTAFAARLGAALVLDGLRHPELSEYDAIAQRMLAGKGFSYEHLDVVYYSFIAPLPAWLSAASYWLVGSLAAAMLLQIAAGAALAGVTFAIARRLFDGWPAPLAAGVLVGLHPGLVLYSADKLHSLAYDPLFFALAVLQLIRMAEQPGLRRAVELGVIVGFGAYSRATIVLALPIGALWLLAVAPAGSRKTALRGAVVAMLCAAGVLAPWSIRNSLIQHRFVFMLTTDSEVFWRGNNPYASGTSYIDAHHLVIDALPAEEIRDLHRQPNELAQSAWFRKRAMSFVLANPGAFVGRAAQKFFYFWWFSPQTGINYSRRWAQVYKAYYVVILALAMLGAWMAARGSGRRPQGLLLILGLALSISVLQSLYYVEGRHRWAVEPLLLVLAGGGVAAIVERRDDHSARLENSRFRMSYFPFGL